MRLLVALALCAAAAAQPQGRITIEYPLEGSLFPPDFAAPTFLFRNSSGSNTAWRMVVRFGGGAPLQMDVDARWLEPGEIDYRAVADTNELPRVPAEKASTRAWRPPRDVWEQIKRRSLDHPATVTLEGFPSLVPSRVVSTGSVTIRTSKDPVGAPSSFAMSR